MKKEKSIWCWKGTVAFGHTGEIDIVRLPAENEEEFREELKELFIVKHALLELEKEFELYGLYK